ncbi:MAG TPA: ROK family transcriptional regulator [Verrucomicrobiae bacterium]|nr:ROK family transcriptional regulator [Verrucomicrobiae bacterium]
MIVVPSRMGRLNKRAVLVHLRRMGTASRADLAKALGLSQPTAGKIVDELIEMGVFEEVPVEVEPKAGNNARSKAGRPARMLRLSQSKARFLAIQLGIQKTTFALPSVGSCGEDAWIAEIETPGSEADLSRRLRETADNLPAKKFWGVIVSVPGVVDERTSKVIFSPNLHWTAAADLPSLIRQVWKAPVILVQEEHALALGHQSADSAEGDDFLLADFGDGVGGAVVIGGKLHSHPLPISGELGHTPVLGNSRRCGCGATGCLETLVSTRGLLQSFAAAKPKATRSWQSLTASVAENGVEPWLAPALDATAVVVAGALNVLGLRHVVITGTISEMAAPVVDYLSAAISRGALWARFGDVKVEPASRRRVAGLVAAGLDRLIMPMPEGRDHMAPVTANTTHS